jgi:hypothetical protein
MIDNDNLYTCVHAATNSSRPCVRSHEPVYEWMLTSIGSVAAAMAVSWHCAEPFTSICIPSPAAESEGTNPSRVDYSGLNGFHGIVESLFWKSSLNRDLYGSWQEAEMQ